MMTFQKKVKDGFTWELFQRWGFAPLRSGSFIINILNFKKFPPDPVKLISWFFFYACKISPSYYEYFQTFRSSKYIQVSWNFAPFIFFFQAFYQRHRHADTLCDPNLLRTYNGLVDVIQLNFQCLFLFLCITDIKVVMFIQTLYVYTQYFI